jgi:hypothetical protein
MAWTGEEGPSNIIRQLEYFDLKKSGGFWVGLHMRTYRHAFCSTTTVTTLVARLRSIAWRTWRNIK